MRIPAILLLTLAAAAGCRPAADEFFLVEERLAIPVERLPARAELPREAANGGRTVRTLVDLSVQVDLPALAEVLAARGAGKLERRRITIAALQEVAARTQEELRPALEALRRQGQLASYRGVSVRNRMLVEATPEGLRSLARRPQVAAIVAETESDQPTWAGVPVAPEPAPRRSWAIASLRAEVAWRQGLDGGGVVVGLVDSGASVVHEQLRDGFAGDERGWYDPRKLRPRPVDGAFGHGTAVLSAAVGRNVAGVTLGVAPGARWVACAALPEGRFNNVWMTLCADWILTTARPDVLINAWLLPEAGCDLAMKPLVDAWRAAEIFPVFAAGNHGAGPGKDRSPANYVGLHPDGGSAFSVGGLTAADEVFPRSTGGPNSCDPAAVFPTVVAPAAAVTTALPVTASTYRQAEGTSMAAGLAAGVAAVLLERHREASVIELERALREGAVDLGVPGPDPRFGHGRLDLPRALAALDRIRGAVTEDGVSQDLSADRKPEFLE